jgi:hypothetical protein
MHLAVHVDRQTFALAEFNAGLMALHRLDDPARLPSLVLIEINELCLLLSIHPNHEQDVECGMVAYHCPNDRW